MPECIILNTLNVTKNLKTMEFYKKLENILKSNKNFIDEHREVIKAKAINFA